MTQILYVPYAISAHGVYRCVKYLNAITFYSEENGWTNENPKLRKKYTYKAIRQYLTGTQDALYFDQDLYCDVYNGDYLWEHYFLSDPTLEARIKRMGFTSLAQLHFYANNAANRR